MPPDLAEAIDDVAERTRFSGVVRVDREGRQAFAKAYGLADRAHGVPNTLETRFGLASGGKGFTALGVVRLIEEGVVGLDTTVRSLLGPDLPLIDDAVTVEHLLAHRSGIGDYLDEGLGRAITEYAMPVPVHQLTTPEDFVKVLDGFPQASPPGERFAYNNGGYAVLALLAERVSGEPYHDLIERTVLAPAGMERTAFLRSDELPGDAAIGYLDEDSPRTNLFHLPIRATGDGGVSSTAGDLVRFWDAFTGGRIVTPAWVEEMLRARSTSADGSSRYGLGFWLHATTEVVWLTGYDAGVSFCSTYDPRSTTIHTVISNTSEGAWDLVRLLDDLLGT